MMTMLVLFLATAVVAEGVAIKWTGIENDQQWSTANNWYPAQVPGPNDKVTINDAEGKDAVVVLSSPTPIAVGSLIVGNSPSNHARLRVLAPLMVNHFLTVQTKGVLEVNSGAASVSSTMLNVAGELEFAAGTLSVNATVIGLMNFATSAAKVLDRSHINIKSIEPVMASGSLQFKRGSTITANVGVKAIGQDFQCIVMDTSTKNSFIADGFSWVQ